MSTNKKYGGIIRFTEVLIIMGLFSLLAGCIGQGGDDTDVTSTRRHKNDKVIESVSELPPAYVYTPDPMPGKFVGIKFEYSGGSMNFATEFDIDVNPAEIVYTSFWDLDKTRDGMITKEHIAITNDQWSDVEKAVTDLWNNGKWQAIPEEILNRKPSRSDEYELDGGDYSRWYLTFETDNGTETIQYYNPSDRRVITLSDVLKEIADPKGRKIEWFEEPYVTGVYYWNNSSDYSFQCTRQDADSDKSYNLFIHDKKNKDKQYISKTVKKSVFEDVWPTFAWIDTSNATSSFDLKIGVTFYYSDGTQRSFEIDKKYAAVMDDILRQYTSDNFGS